jgi:hypothetical protein
MFMLVYVDDIVIVSSCSTTIKQLLTQLTRSFPVKDLGPLNFFLGIEAVSNSRGWFLLNKSMLWTFSDEYVWRIVSLFKPLFVYQKNYQASVALLLATKTPFFIAAQ